MFQRFLIAAMTLFLLVLVACAPAGTTLHAQPLNVTPPKDLCADVVVGENMRCDAGQLSCDDGFKTCGEGCIPEGTCCTDDDCGADRQCVNTVCVDRQLCKFNEVWDDERKECSCAENAKFCQEQNKCIPFKSCCWHSDCSGERCAPTTYSGTVCIFGETKKCKVVHEGGVSQSFFFPEGSYEVAVQQVLEDGIFTLRVNDETLSRLETNETRSGEGFSIFVENVNTFGGLCRELPE